MTENRLAREVSPYLLQHQDNPVHWWSWGPEALAEAKASSRPILLSVGYAACHWCHVMAHESFEDAETAALMNALYVNIKVDREERPDIDAVYMAALHALGEQGGWPLTMFLTADAEPFWGGTYFPKEDRFGRPGFKRVLREIARLYSEDGPRIAYNAAAIRDAVTARRPAGDGAAAVTLPFVADVARRLAEAVDLVHGGLSGAPKFPHYSIFWFLWQAGIRFDLPDCRDAVLVTLRNLCQGGIYDHIGGGFARYSVDRLWLVPHFEKMLYDNALLVQLLTEAWRETAGPLFRQRIEETADWLISEMGTPEGAFAASYDADSEGEEGKFYLWSPAEIAAVLGPEDGALYCRIYDITEAGNFEGRSIPNRLAKLELEDFATEQRLIVCHGKLHKARAKRVPPGWDDKVLADWNGLTVAALVEAGRAFDRPDWIAFAEQAYAFVAEKMSDGGRLWHSFRAGQFRGPGTASDYANMIAAGLALYQATNRSIYLERAVGWVDTLRTHFWIDGRGGYALTADDTADVIVRTEAANDDATPNANAVMLSNLVKLHALTGGTEYIDRAEDILRAFAADVAAVPTAHAGLLTGAIELAAPLQIVIAGAEPGHQSNPLSATLQATGMPGATEQNVADTTCMPPQSPLAGKAAIGGRPTAYVCASGTCSAPLTDAAEFRALLVLARHIAPVATAK